MTGSRYESLEMAIADPCFPEVDITLRRGRHFGSEDGALHQYLVDALEHLEPFYRRFGCELIYRSEGYFYLLPQGDRLGRRQLSPGEMLVGQTLALMYLDPEALRHSGSVPRETLLQRLEGLVGVEALVRILEPRRRRVDERIIAELIRKKVGEALRKLAELGFVDTLDGTRLRLRSALMRFADPVRGSEDTRAALSRLAAGGEIDLDDVDPDSDSDADPDEAGDDSKSEDEGAFDNDDDIPDDTPEGENEHEHENENEREHEHGTPEDEGKTSA
ncbi:MAG: chromosome partition protein MukE [Ectothiorhodospiraceae bacterium AqS1]|nr:chromosome partition protein MukE [Ectothiorhodospiraceae bacterium AqS1]